MLPNCWCFHSWYVISFCVVMKDSLFSHWVTATVYHSLPHLIHHRTLCCSTTLDTSVCVETANRKSRLNVVTQQALLHKLCKISASLIWLLAILCTVENNAQIKQNNLYTVWHAMLTAASATLKRLRFGPVHTMLFCDIDYLLLFFLKTRNSHWTNIVNNTTQTAIHITLFWFGLKLVEWWMDCFT